MSWLPSGHHVVNSYLVGASVSTRLRRLSTALVEELRSLTLLSDSTIIIGSRLTVFFCFCILSLFWFEFVFFFFFPADKKQAEDMAGEGPQGPTPFQYQFVGCFYQMLLSFIELGLFCTCFLFYTCFSSMFLIGNLLWSACTLMCSSNLVVLKCYAHQHHPEGGWKHRWWGPHPRVSNYQWVWAGAWECACLTNSQVRRRRLVQGPPFENHRFTLSPFCFISNSSVFCIVLLFRKFSNAWFD